MIQWLHLQIKCLDLFGHGLTLEAVSYFVIVMFDCHNLSGKAVRYFIVVMFLWSQLTSLYCCDVFMVTVDVAKLKQ